MELGNAADTVDLLNMTILKRILKTEGLPIGGKKDELVARTLEIPKERLEELIELRRYKITKKGSEILEKYDDIIQRHGPKM